MFIIKDIEEQYSTKYNYVLIFRDCILPMKLPKSRKKIIIQESEQLWFSVMGSWVEEDIMDFEHYPISNWEAKSGWEDKCV